MIFPVAVKQMLLYLIVGVEATVVEWAIFYLADVAFGLHYTVATIIAFAVSTLANWWGGRLLLFKAGDKRGLVHELCSIYAVSTLGLLANLAIMWICINCLTFCDMLAKIIATGIVFCGNFVVRKFLIYKI